MNKARAIIHLFPGADPMFDFIVAEEDGVQRIAAWYLDDPIPTEAELVAAYDAAVAAEAAEIAQPTPEEQIALLTEQNEQLRVEIEAVKADNLATMEAIALLNEKIGGAA